MDGGGLMNTSGFYKNDAGALLWAPNFVQGPGFTLDCTEPGDWTLEVNGWAWFNSQEEAEAAYGITAPAA